MSKFWIRIKRLKLLSKKVVCIMLIFTLIMSLASIALAGPESPQTLQSAIDNIDPAVGGTIELGDLGGNISASDIASLNSKGNVTIDGTTSVTDYVYSINGDAAPYNIVFDVSGNTNLTLTNVKINGGRICVHDGATLTLGTGSEVALSNASGNNLAIQVSKGATLNVNGGKITYTNATGNLGGAAISALNENSTVNFNSGTIISDDIGIVPDGAEVNIKGGKIQGNRYAIQTCVNFGPTQINITGGILSGDTGVQLDGLVWDSVQQKNVKGTYTPTLTMSGGEIQVANTGIRALDGPKVNITGGKVTSGVTGIQVNGDYNTEVNVSGGQIISDIGVYIDGRTNNNGSGWQQATNPAVLTLSAGNIKGKHNGIIAVYSAIVNATGGFISGNQPINNDGTCSINTTGAKIINGELVNDGNPPNANMVSITLKSNIDGSSTVISLPSYKNVIDVDIPNYSDRHFNYADMEANMTSFEVSPTVDTNNAAAAVSVTGIITEGSSTFQGNKIYFNSISGYAQSEIDVTLFYNNQIEKRHYILNLIQNKFKGIVITPDVAIGEWGANYKGFDCDLSSGTVHYNTTWTKAFVGAKKVNITLPQCNNDIVKKFEVTSVEGNGSFVKNSDNNYTVTLDTGIDYQTRVHMKINDDNTDYIVYIDQMALTAGSWGDGSKNYTVKVTYTSDPSFPITDPKMLAVYYHEDGHYESGYWVVDSKTVLGTKTFTLPDYDPLHPVTVIDVAIGNELKNSETDANCMSVFLISGQVNADDVNFGGVKFGGAGFNESLPNHPVPQQ